MNLVVNGVVYIPKPRIKKGQPFSTGIRKARENSGDTLQQVADAVGTTKSHIWSLEKGVSEPRLNTIKKLLDYYGLRFEDVSG